MPTHLDQILTRTRADLAQRKQQVSRADLERRAAAHTPRGFAAALRARSTVEPAIIAELKKASPSKGLIRANFDAATLAPIMQAAGAAALSVLTDEPFFQGSLENLEAASRATTLPCLRKDFILDEYQLLEARAHRADAVLLIAAALTDPELAQLAGHARELSLDVVCEVHTLEEARRIRHLGCALVGVNNRDLRTFEVRLEKSLELAAELPSDAVLVSESGIAHPADYARLHAAGFRAFLIGETFMRQPDPGRALAAWIAQAASIAQAAQHTTTGAVPA
ncbi:MAG TPA: indole-3-glycerol phosphate synthase TrpC [Steroidobacteraceae bacterium]|jgi:indole-3-glycerol phosphate synthase